MDVAAGKGAFRVKDWWWSKAALLMGMVYLFAIMYNIRFAQFIPLSILSLITITGFASMGYLFNDLFDIEKDALAGKVNFLAGKPAVLIVFLFLVSTAFVMLPWLFLPKSRFSFALIALQFALFIIYSAPPIRLKERGLTGIIADALYAHSVPTLLAVYTFALAAHSIFSVADIWLLFLWQTIAGIRNIVLHQSEDMGADKISGSYNFVATLKPGTMRLLLGLMIGAEWFLSLSFFTLLMPVNQLFAVCILVTLVLSASAFMLFMERGAPPFLNSIWKFFPNNLYEKWLPLIYLAILSAGDVRFVILLIIHLTIFNFDFYLQTADRLYGRWRSTPYKGYLITARVFLSYPGNYFIYYSFKIFGVDLRQKNISAWKYIFKKLRIK